jgi:hypothetical protein
VNRATTELIIFNDACEQVAKRLDVDDVDYAERWLCRKLMGAVFGRDWFASQVEPEEGDIPTGG